MQVGAVAASRLPSTLLGEGCVHRASQVESQVPILSPCACWPHSPTTEWQDLGGCLLPLVWAMHQMYFLSGGGDGKLVKRVPFLLENDLTAAKRIMG